MIHARRPHLPDRRTMIELGPTIDLQIFSTLKSAGRRARSRPRVGRS